ncbi:MAG: ribosome-associated translation inhibitor RaiA [Pseudomonadota bacterium]
MTVTGKQVDVGAALRGHCEEKIRAGVEKYAQRPVDAHLTLSKDAHLFVCDCNVRLSTGLSAVSTAKNEDPYNACDQAISRLEKQLRRYKRRLKDHHIHRKQAIPAIEAKSYVIHNEEEDSSDPDPAQNGGLWQPTIVAEAVETVPTFSVGEAVMQMELTNTEFLLFINEVRGSLNAVYRRKDGHIGWIDPPSA